MSDPIAILKQALAIVAERGQTYNEPGAAIEESFSRSASIAGLWLNRTVTAREVAIILASVKMSRTAVSPDHADSYLDLCNYVAFAAAFSTEQVSPAPAKGADLGEITGYTQQGSTRRNGSASDPANNGQSNL